MAEQPNGEAAVQDGPTFLPPTDILETKDALILLLDMPGADPDSLDVSLEQRALSVSARATSTPPTGYQPVHAEYRDGSYQRGFTLSDQVDGDRIEAVLKDGVLRLTLPKLTPSPAKKITVQAA